MTEREYSTLLQQAREAYARLSPEEKQAHDREQRISWCVGQCMLANPELTRERAIELATAAVDREREP